MAKYTMFAAIELGSADIIMKIVRISKRNGIEVIDSLRYNISLGAEVYHCGRISYHTVEEICNCLDNCMRVIREYGVDNYSCYATTAVREAANNDYFIDQISIRCGIKVKIITNAEEIFLHNKAFALNSTYFDDIIDAGAVIVDVNTGNTQVSCYSRSTLKFSQSLPIGSLRVYEMLTNVSDMPIGFSGLLEDYIGMKIENYKEVFFKTSDFSYIAVTGTQASQIKRICGGDGDVVSSEQMDKVYNMLKNGDMREICEKYGFSNDEAELLFPTVLIYKMFVYGDKGKTVLIPSLTTADGMCVEFAERNGYTHTKHIFTNDIISSAKSCAARFNVGAQSYNSVIEYCERIFNAMSKKFGMSGTELLLLKLAAIFADTGKYININGYTAHSSGIVNSNPILGLSHKEQKTVAYTVLFAEGAINDEEYKYFPKSLKLTISKLTALLMIARSLNSAPIRRITDIKASVKNGVLTITAYSKKDITFERLEFERVCGFFEDVFGIKAKLNLVKN